MGGYLGGNLLSTKPTYHYFAEDMTQIQSSLAFLLAQPLHTPSMSVMAGRCGQNKCARLLKAVHSLHVTCPLCITDSKLGPTLPNVQALRSGYGSHWMMWAQNHLLRACTL